MTSNDWQPDKFEIAPFCHDGANHPPTIFGLIRKARPAAETGLELRPTLARPVSFTVAPVWVDEAAVVRDLEVYPVRNLREAADGVSVRALLYGQREDHR